MPKTFHEILAEKDEEFTYFVKSTNDIHYPERFERVRMALMPYRIKSIAVDAYTPPSQNNRTFPMWPNYPTYSIKVVTGLPVDTHSVLQTMAMIVHVHQSHFVMEPEDDVQSELVGKPIEVDSTSAQKLVGDKRIGEFMRELQADRKDREKKEITREVYESFFTTHRGLENVIKKPVRNGYYMVEMSREGDATYLRADGPYGARPDGNVYRDGIRVEGAQIVSESASGDLYTVQVLIDAVIDPPVNEKMFEVGVRDMESGRHYTSMVRAANADLARDMALQQVAEANRIDPASLTAMAPKTSRNQQ